MPDRFKIFMFIVLAFVCVAFLTVPAQAKSIQGKTIGPAKIQVPIGWQIFKSKSGLVVFHPRSWQVREFPDRAFVALGPNADGGVGPFVLAQPLISEDRSENVVASIGEIMPRIFPDVRLSEVRSLSSQPDVAEAHLEYDKDGRSYEGFALCFKQGSQGMLYTAAAPSALWPLERDTALHVLVSFMYGRSIGAMETAGSAASVLLVEDANTGEHFEIQSGSNYYWLRGTDNAFVGARADTRQSSPNYWLKRMKATD